MKLEHYAKQPKVDLDDYTPTEQKLMMLMSGVRGQYNTDYWGMEKAITVRLNCNNVPDVEALAELSGLSKNLVINDVLELGFGVLADNLSEGDKEKYFAKVREKHTEWLAEYKNKEQK